MSVHVKRLIGVGIIGVWAVIPGMAAAKTGFRPVSCSQRQTTTDVGCFAELETGAQEAPLVSSAPDGYGPAQFHAAYTAPNQSSRPVTVAVVAAYHDPNIKRDLRSYDAAFGLPEPPTFSQLSQRGGSDFPRTDSGWALEMSMDIETIHQICQNCPLLLVEADSPSLPNLMAAIDTAAAHGAKIISNSYGGSESATEVRYDSHLQHAGVTAIASSGDSGYGVSYPAASAAVVAVGGTTLQLNSKGGRLAETAWDQGGSGCSRYEAKPVWQQDKGCAKRTVVDVGADADPATGAAIYDSLAYQAQQGWFVLGGTSLSAPLVAGMYGLAGGGTARGLYQASAGLHDVTSGRNGSCRTYLCQSGAGYDGPTGLGSPIGLAAFH